MESNTLGRALTSIEGFQEWFFSQDVNQFVAGFFWFLVIVSVFWSLWRLKMIREIITQFNNARGPIWDLRGTIAELKELEPVIRQLGDQMSLLDAKVDAARLQVTELQVESVSGRTEMQRSEPTNASTPFQSDQNQTDDENWEQLRLYWRRNVQRLENVIQSIPDGRTRLAFDRMPRTNYRAIVARLEDGKYISNVAANASRDLIDTFNKYRPRNQRVSNAVLGATFVFDEQLDKALYHIERFPDEVVMPPKDTKLSTQPSSAPQPTMQQPALSFPHDNLS